MFQKIVKLILIALIFGGVMTSCEYEKILKSTNYRLKYNKALEYYHEEDYSRAIGLFEQINPALKATDRADTVQYYLANAYYNQRDYILAKHYFNDFYQTFGNHQWAEEAEFMSAYCDYKMSPRPSLEQKHTYRAINSFELFIRRHPESPKSKEAHDLIKELRDKLAIKAYNAAKLYYDMEDYKAAIISLNNCLKRFPNTKHREEIRFLILKSNFLLASNSIKAKEQQRYQSTLDEYYTFVNQYPESEYNEEVKNIYEVTQRNLNN